MKLTKEQEEALLNKWGYLLEGISDRRVKIDTAIILDNTASQMVGLKGFMDLKTGKE